MRRIPTLIALLLLAMAPGYAQFQRGDMFLNGDAGFNFGNESSMFNSPSPTERAHYSFNLAPSFGYLLSERLAVGLSLDYRYSREDIERRSTSGGPVTRESQLRQPSFSPQAFLRYYQPIGENFGLLFDAYAGVLFGSRKYEDNFFNDEDKLRGFDIGLRPGIYYFLSHKVALEASLGGITYSSLRTESVTSEWETKETAFTTIFDSQNLNLRLGVSYFLTRAEASAQSPNQ